MPVRPQAWLCSFCLVNLPGKGEKKPGEALEKQLLKVGKLMDGL